MVNLRISTISQGVAVMAMDSINRNAKYVVLTFGALIALGMLFMGPFDFTNTADVSYVGKVDGNIIPLESFRDELNRVQEQRRNQTGHAPEGLDLVQLRNDLFNEKVRSVVVGQLRDALSLYASPEEMWNYLETNPIPGLEQDTNFQTNGTFDRQKYLQWLHDPQTLDYPFMRSYEASLKSDIIPAMQLMELARSQSHPTSLEKAFEDFKRGEKAKIHYYFYSMDSVDVADSIGDAELQAYFNSEPDSFYRTEEAAKLGYLSVNIAPSAADSAEYLELIEDLRERILSDSNFEEIAISYSDDPGSAENGGSLGGFQTRDKWVKEFGDAAEKLSEGELSQPVLSQFGYHLIKCNGVREDSVKEWDLSHILIKIETTPETVDSAISDFEVIRQKALDQKISLKEIAASQGLEYAETGVIYKDNYSPFGNYQYVPGLHSFAFAADGESAQVSEVLQNESAIFLFEKLSHFPPGRNFERDRDQIQEKLITKRKILAAMEALQNEFLKKPADSSPAQLGKAYFDTTELVSALTWLPGIGYNAQATHLILNQKEGEWGNIIETDFGAVVAKISEKTSASFEDALKASGQTPVLENPAVGQDRFQQWMEIAIQSREVENNLDLIYRN